MSWKNVKLIFTREVRDQLRDRRTLFMIAVLPLLLYPALGIGMVQMMVMFSEQPRTVLILGTDNLPATGKENPYNEFALPPLVQDGHFVSTYFKIPSDAQKLNVYTDRDVKDGKPTPAAITQIAPQGQRIRELALKQRQLHREKSEWDQSHTETDSDPFPKEEDLSETKKQLMELVEGVQVILIIPDGFGDHIEDINRKLASREFEEITPLSDEERPIILRNSADEKSMVAYNRVSEAIHSWETVILEDRLTQAQLPETFAEPVRAEPIDLAEDKALSAVVWSKMFPALLVIMAVTGAFYPAVDLAAGEKERGTMETLLICPASRSEIVIGKFFTVMLFSISTAILNMISMGFTGKYIASISPGGALGKIGVIQPPPIESLMWIALLMIPLAALFSAMCLALATFARSTKEGQYYLTPLLMVVMGLTVFCLAPGREIDSFSSVMPVVGATLLLKEMLADPGSQAALYFGLPVVITSIGYSLIALWWAIDQFAREDVLFREAERFELRLWFRHLLRDKESTPTFAEAGFCFAMIMLLQFAAMKFMNQAVMSAGPDHVGERMMQLLMIQQIAIIASPALFMGIMLTTNVRKTFRFRLPSWKLLGLGMLLPFVLHPLSLELSSFLGKHFFPPLPPSVGQQLQTMSDMDQPLWLIILAFAIAPAICEEIAFRGFILSGFGRSKRVWLAIGLSSLLFGLMHMIPQQVYNAALLGLVLGLLAIKSGSLLPCIVFHFLWNSLGAVHGRVSNLEGVEVLNERPWNWLFSVEVTPLGNQIHYQWPLLVAMAALGSYLIYRLIQLPGVDESPKPSKDVTNHYSLGQTPLRTPSEKPVATP